MVFSDYLANKMRKEADLNSVVLKLYRLLTKCEVKVAGFGQGLFCLFMV